MKTYLTKIRSVLSHLVKRHSGNISMEDVRVLNDGQVSWLRTMSLADIAKRVSRVSTSGINSDFEKLLRDEGIAIIPNFLAKNELDAMKSSLLTLQGEVEAFIQSGIKSRQKPSLYFQIGKRKYSTFPALANANETVVYVREGQDAGMVDVFNVDIAFPDFGGLRKIYAESGILNHITDDLSQPRLTNLNIYLNKEITATRGFHVDSYEKQLKAFIYLTDCKSLDDGPYTYVRGSHRESAYRRVNKAMSKHLLIGTETPVFPIDKVVPVVAPAGSLVVSDQSGFHRGFPQSLGFTRAVAVMNIKQGAL